MGYQESYIYTDRNSDIEKILNIFVKHDIRCEDDDCARCAAKITLKKDIEGHTNEGIKLFKEGKTFLYLYGERFAQRNVEGIYNIDDKKDFKRYTKEELEIINRTKSMFAECMPSDIIFGDKNIANVEFISVKALEPEPIYMDRARDFMDRACVKNENEEEIPYSYKIFSHNEFLELRNNLINVCKEMDIDLNVSDGFAPTLPDISERFYKIKGSRDTIVFSYHKTPHLENLGSWWQPHNELHIRALARIFKEAAESK